MLWLIAVMIGLDLRRGFSDHILACMFVDALTKAHGLDLHQRFQCWREAMVFSVDASHLGVLGGEGSKLKCQRQRELLLDFGSVSGCWILQLQGYGV